MSAPRWESFSELQQRITTLFSEQISFLLWLPDWPPDDT